MRKAILTTGGTGGHIFPALAVAEELRKRYPDVHIVFMGGFHGPEEKMAKEAGLDFKGLPVRGIFGRGLKSAGAVWAMLSGINQARIFIKKFQPEFVAGFGGYASAAAVLGGILASVPTAVHEQNSVSGMANKLAGRFADRVFISMPDRFKAFKPEKTRLTGNPVRASIAGLYKSKMARAEKGETLPGRNLLVMGGSQGARAINETFLVCLPEILAAGFRVRWQTGPKEYERIWNSVRILPGSAASGAFASQLTVAPFIDDMAAAYAWADLALCRAGATSVVELAASGVPAVFVPFPAATHDHQLYNAVQAQEHGAAMVLEQKDLTPGLVFETVRELLQNGPKLRAMSRAALLSARPDAVGVLADELEILSEMKKR